MATLSCADEIAWGIVGPSGKLDNVAFDWTIANASGADNFFIDNPMDSHDFTSVAMVRNSLLSEVKVATARNGKIKALEEALRPIFTAMPKNSEGRLNNGTARYTLHRLFSERQGWSIKGLQPAGASWIQSRDDENRLTSDVQYILKYMA